MNNLLKFVLMLVVSFSMNVAMAQTDDDDDRYDDDRSEYNDRDPQDWLKNVVVGGSIFPGYSNGWILEVSPLVGYRVTPSTTFGVGFNYFYRDVRYPNDPRISKDVFNTYGGRAFVMQNFFQDFFAQLELDYNFARSRRFDSFDDIIFQDNWESPGFLAGLGYTQGDQRFSYNISALYDLLFDDFESTRSSPLVFRASFIIALF